MFWTEEWIVSFQDMRTMFGQWFLLPFMTTERVATTSSCVYDKFWTERMHIERKLERSFIDRNENICLCFTIDVFSFQLNHNNWKCSSFWTSHKLRIWNISSQVHFEDNIWDFPYEIITQKLSLKQSRYLPCDQRQWCSINSA